MLGKLRFDFQEPESSIELPLDESIKLLKYYKKEMPWNLYKLSSKQAHCLKKMLLIIEGLTVPEKMIDD